MQRAAGGNDFDASMRTKSNRSMEDSEDNLYFDVKNETVKTLTHRNDYLIYFIHKSN